MKKILIYVNRSLTRDSYFLSESVFMFYYILYRSSRLNCSCSNILRIHSLLTRSVDCTLNCQHLVLLFKNITYLTCLKKKKTKKKRNNYTMPYLIILVSRFIVQKLNKYDKTFKKCVKRFVIQLKKIHPVYCYPPHFLSIQSPYIVKVAQTELACVLINNNRSGCGRSAHQTLYYYVAHLVFWVPKFCCRLNTHSRLFITRFLLIRTSLKNVKSHFSITEFFLNFKQTRTIYINNIPHRLSHTFLTLTQKM